MITLCEKPRFPKKKLSPQQQAGLCYERKVFKFFRLQKKLFPLEWTGQLLHSPWFKVEEREISFHNPDILLINGTSITIFECKLGQTETAIPQLRRYERICSQFFGLPTRMVCVFRNLYRQCELITSLPPASTTNLFFWHLYL